MRLRRALSDLIHIRRTTQESVEVYTESSKRFLAGKIKSIELSIRIQHLQDRTINSTEKGISKERYCDNEVIVSLTTFGKRLYEVYLAIESIMQGTVKPNRIILWISDELKNKPLPVVLEKQKLRGLEIEYCKDIRSYTKLVPALYKYPEACIITIDDDILYEPDIVENLLSAYKEHPECVNACRTHKVKFDNNGNILPYRKWDLNSYTDKPSYMNFLTGVGGVLYPPHIFPKEVFNEEVFLGICKYADDVWFYAMLIINSIKINKAFTHSPMGEDMLFNESPNEPCLQNTNNGENNLNDVQIASVFKKYRITDILLNSLTESDL